MEEELEPFADDEYEPKEIHGRMTLKLYGEPDDGELHGEAKKRKKIEAGKIPKIYEAMRKGWDIDIHYAVIDGDIDIGKAGLEQDESGKYIIAGHVHFYGTSFTGHAWFIDASFTGHAWFIGASFAQDVYTFGIVGPAKANFNRASFAQSANFREASFAGKAQFIEASFAQDADFREASFAVNACFKAASFAQGANFMGASFTVYTDFEGARFMYPANFFGVVILENTVWCGLWNYLLRPLLWPILWLFTIGRIRLSRARFTRMLEINTNTVMDTSSNPRLKRYIDDEQWIHSWRTNPKGRWWREPVFRLWELTSHCGRSIGLWAFWSVLFAVTFAFIYIAFGNDSITFSVDMAGALPDFRAYLYYSVVTFTTLGFGDIIPKTHWARFAVGAEVVLGYTMLGGLISIFANKFARRS